MKPHITAVICCVCAFHTQHKMPVYGASIRNQDPAHVGIMATNSARSTALHRAMHQLPVLATYECYCPPTGPVSSRSLSLAHETSFLLTLVSTCKFHADLLLPPTMLRSHGRCATRCPLCLIVTAKGMSIPPADLSVQCPREGR